MKKPWEVWIKREDGRIEHAYHGVSEKNARETYAIAIKADSEGGIVQLLFKGDLVEERNIEK